MTITHDENGLIVDGHHLTPAEVQKVMDRINYGWSVYHDSPTGVMVGAREIFPWSTEYQQLVAYLNDVQVIPA